MTALEYLKEKNRMTKGCNIPCITCPFSPSNNGLNYLCSKFFRIYPEKAIAIVEKWSKENPKETYQSYLLKHFPNFEMSSDNRPNSCVKKVFGTDNPKCLDISCIDCWNQEYIPNTDSNK